LAFEPGRSGAAAVLGIRNIRLRRSDDFVRRLDLAVGPEDPLEEIVIGKRPERLAVIERIQWPESIREDVVIGVRPEHRSEPADKSTGLMPDEIAGGTAGRSRPRKGPAREESGGAHLELRHGTKADMVGFGSGVRFFRARTALFRLR